MKLLWIVFQQDHHTLLFSSLEAKVVLLSFFCAPSLGPGMRRMGRKPEGDGSRPQGGDGRPPTDRRPVDRRPPRRFERPAGEGGERPEGGEFSVEK